MDAENDPTLLLGPFRLMKPGSVVLAECSLLCCLCLSWTSNECIKGSQNCRLGETCVNTVGSFRCQRDSSCGTGYELTEDNDCKVRQAPGTGTSPPGVDAM